MIRHYSGDVISLVSHWSDPKLEWMYSYQATCKALYHKRKHLWMSWRPVADKRSGGRAKRAPTPCNIYYVCDITHAQPLHIIVWLWHLSQRREMVWVHLVLIKERIGTATVALVSNQQGKGSDWNVATNSQVISHLLVIVNNGVTVHEQTCIHRVLTKNQCTTWVCFYHNRIISQAHIPQPLLHPRASLNHWANRQLTEYKP